MTDLSTSRGLPQAPGAPGEPDLFFRVAEANPVALMITDVEGRIVYANPALERATGYAREELVGQNPRIFRPGEAPPADYRAMWTSILAGTPWDGEILNRRKSGELCRDRLRIVPVRDAAGTVRHFLALMEGSGARQGTPGPATFDPLTGLPDRTQFLARAHAALLEAAARGDTLTVVDINIDGFRHINESLGSRTGDQVLVAVAHALLYATRHHDTLARLGDDEFGLLLPGRPADGDPDVEPLERIRAAVASPIQIEGQTVHVTARLGAALYPRDATDADSLIQAVNAAVRRAREAGGDRVCIFRPELAQGARPSRQARLRRAIEDDELRLHFQPQVHLLSGDIVGVEALVRWQHPELGLLPPGNFVPLAEESGLIVPMGEWVLRAACRQARQWRDAGLRPVRIGVNLGAQHLHRDGLPDHVAGLLRESGMEPRHLDLELTESAMLQDVAAAVRVVDRIKALGVHLSLDDFGTGYSSLAHLSRLAIDTLKIDQSFIRDITTNPGNASIVAATVAMAHKLRMDVIAEGVETETQLATVRRLGCDEIQGYFFSRPLPPEGISEMLHSDISLRANDGPDHDALPTLLLVDDEPNVLAALSRVFRREGYHLITASNALQALEIMALNTVQVVISDQRMPEMTGTEFLSRVKDLYPDTVRIVLSGYSDGNVVTEAINRGAIAKYFTKPWDDETVRREVRRLFRAAAARPQQAGG